MTFYQNPSMYILYFQIFKPFPHPCLFWLMTNESMLHEFYHLSQFSVPQVTVGYWRLLPVCASSVNSFTAWCLKTRASPTVTPESSASISGSMESGRKSSWTICCRRTTTSSSTCTLWITTSSGAHSWRRPMPSWCLVILSCSRNWCCP